MKNEKIMKGVMIFWTLFIGIGAVAGATGMLVAPDGSAMGMELILQYFKVLPFADTLFQNFIFPGISLLIVNGISNLMAFVLIVLNKKYGAVLGTIFGFTLMLWITIQFIILPQNFMSITYFIFGALQFVCGLVYIIFIKQNAYTFDISEYTNVGKNHDTLVVYFSRRGYTEKIAYEKADETGADIFRITTPERTAGFLGFAWLGRFGMHGWAMDIDKISVDVSAYKNVIIVTPVYVFTAAAPIKGFCKETKGKINSVNYICVHFCRAGFKNVFGELDRILGTESKHNESVVCRIGKEMSRKIYP